MGIIESITQYGTFTTTVLGMVFLYSYVAISNLKLKIKLVLIKVTNPDRDLEIIQPFLGKVLDIMWFVSAYWLYNVYFG